MKILLKASRVVDPSQGLDAAKDVLIQDDVIVKVGDNLTDKDAQVIDLKGTIVTPGFVDLHCHLREPGFEGAETIRTGTRSAAMGGFTSIACMPNTQPVIDDLADLKFIQLQSQQEGVVEVLPVAAITKNSQGEELSEIGELARLGAVAISDDGKPVMNSSVMRRALEYSKMFGIPVMSHAEDLNLTGEGEMNEGYWSTVLGLAGIPNVSEDVMIARDILLSEFTDGRLHVCHVSTENGVEQIRQAKRRGVKVTAEVTPHHLSLTDAAVRDYDTNTKIKPPLRSERDRDAVRQGLKDGTIDAIATDHAPHTIVDKECEYKFATFGTIGFETAFAVVYTHLVEPGIITLNDAVKAMTSSPAGILGISRGTLKVGAQANITAFDPKLEMTYEQSHIVSKSKNSVFLGQKLKGFPVLTICCGKVIMSDRKMV